MPCAVGIYEHYLKDICQRALQSDCVCYSELVDSLLAASIESRFLQGHRSTG